MTKRKVGRKRRVPVITQPSPPGASPGTIVASETAPKPVVSLFGFGPDGLTESAVDDPASLQDHCGKWPILWVNIDGLGDRDVLMSIGETFNVHRLALEDVVNVHQRAKVEAYEDQLFIIARLARQAARLETEQISLFVGEGYIVSFQERAGDCFDLVRQRIRSGRPMIRRNGPGYLAYALLDALIDSYFPLLESYGEQIEQLEDEVMAGADASLARRIHRVKRELLVLRRALWPHREALNALLRDESGLINEETQVHLRDCYDHAIQALDMVETYRELASGLLDVYLTQVSNRMNEVMKVLTIFAAIFIPLTFMAGLYGMNFQNMPELSWPWAYPVLLLMMLIVAAVMLWFFRRRGWLGGKAAIAPDEKLDRP